MILFALICVAAAYFVAVGHSPSQRPARKTSRSERAVAVTDQPIELVLDVSASLLESGMPIKDILDTLGLCVPQCAQLRIVARCLELNMEWQRSWQVAEDWLQPLERALHFAQATGAPAASLLRNAASLQRRERTQRVARLGAQFGTRLVLPLGACALPAFIALGVVPLIIALIPGL